MIDDLTDGEWYNIFLEYHNAFHTMDTVTILEAQAIDFLSAVKAVKAPPGSEPDIIYRKRLQGIKIEKI